MSITITKQQIVECFNAVENFECSFPPSFDDWKEKKLACKASYDKLKKIYLQHFQDNDQFEYVGWPTDNPNPEEFLNYVQDNSLDAIKEALSKIDQTILSDANKKLKKRAKFINYFYGLGKKLTRLCIVFFVLLMLTTIALSVLWGLNIRRDEIAYGIGAFDFMVGIIAIMREIISDRREGAINKDHSPDEAKKVADGGCDDAYEYNKAGESIFASIENPKQNAGESFLVVKNSSRFVHKRQPVVYISASAQDKWGYDCAVKLKQRLDEKGIPSFWGPKFNSYDYRATCRWDTYTGDCIPTVKVNFGLVVSSIFISFAGSNSTADKKCQYEFEKFAEFNTKNSNAKKFVHISDDQIKAINKAGDDVKEKDCYKLESYLKKRLPSRRSYSIIASDGDAKHRVTEQFKVDGDAITVLDGSGIAEDKQLRIDKAVTEALKRIEQRIKAVYPLWYLWHWRHIANGVVKENSLPELQNGDDTSDKDLAESLKHFHDGCNTPSDWFFKYTVIDENGNDMTIEAPNPEDQHFEMFLERDYTTKKAEPCVHLCLVVNDWNVWLLNKKNGLGDVDEKKYPLANYSSFKLQHKGENDRILSEVTITKENTTVNVNIPGRVLAYSGNKCLGKIRIDDVNDGNNGIMQSGTYVREIVFSSDKTFYVYAQVIKKAVINYDILGVGGKSYKILTHRTIRREVKVDLVRMMTNYKLNNNEVKLNAGRHFHSVTLRGQTEKPNEAWLAFHSKEEKDQSFIVLRKAPHRSKSKTLLTVKKSPVQCIYCAHELPKRVGNGISRKNDGRYYCDNNPNLCDVPLPEGYFEKPHGAVVAMLGAANSGKSIFLSRLFESIIDIDKDIEDIKKSGTSFEIQPVVKRAFKNIGISIVGDVFFNDTSLLGYPAYNIQLCTKLPNRTIAGADLSGRPFVCKIGSSYISFFDIPGEDLKGLKTTFEQNNDLHYAFQNSNFWLLCVSDDNLKQNDAIMQALIHDIQCQDSGNSIKSIGVAVVLCKSDKLASNVATINMTSPQIDWRYKGSPLERYIDSNSDEVRAIIGANQDGEELITTLESKFRFIKYFAVSALGSENSLTNITKKVEGKELTADRNITIPKYLVNPTGIENVLAWFCYQIGILR